MEIVSAVRLNALAQLDASALPTEFRIFQFGDNPSSKGTFKLDAESANSILSAYQQQGVELAIDYEHQTFGAASNGKPAPAAGWFKPEIRSDGLWASGVRWTPGASQMLQNREYRYFSPTFEIDKEKRITRLLPLALTNFPASQKQKPLIAAKADAAPKTHTEKLNMSNLSTIVGLKDDASEDAVTNRVIMLARLESRLLEATGKDNIDDAMVVVHIAKDAVAEVQQLKKLVHDWEDRHQRDQAEEKNRQIESEIQRALLERRVSLRDTDRLTRWRKEGEEFGVAFLTKLINEREPAPIRQYQAPPPVNTVKAQLAAIEKYVKDNPNSTRGDAYIALAASNPAIFGDANSVPVEE